MSNGDSGADTNPALFEHVEQPVDYNALIDTALTVEFGTEPDGANFTVILRQIQLTPERAWCHKERYYQCNHRAYRASSHPSRDVGGREPSSRPEALDDRRPRRFMEEVWKVY